MISFTPPQGPGNRATLLGRLGDLLELLWGYPRHLRLGDELNPGDGGLPLHHLQVHPGLGGNPLGGKSLPFQRGRQGHGEAPRMGRGDELLGVRPLPLLKAGGIGVGPLEGLAF